jgi:hypothetical protein
MVCGLVHGDYVNLCTVLRTAFQLACLLGMMMFKLAGITWIYKIITMASIMEIK